MTFGKYIAIAAVAAWWHWSAISEVRHRAAQQCLEASTKGKAEAEKKWREYAIENQRQLEAKRLDDLKRLAETEQRAIDLERELDAAEKKATKAGPQFWSREVVRELNR